MINNIVSFLTASRMKHLYRRADRTSFRFVCTLLTSMSMLWVSCDWINPDEELPAYITINDFQLTTDYTTQGTTSQKITDAWIFVDDEIAGAYELPAHFPLLKKGKHTISVYPGIKMNGIAATRVIYPFYNPHDFNVDLKDLETTTLSPTTSYASFTDIPFMEDFENAGSGFAATSKSDTVLLKSSASEAFEGKASGHIYLEPGRDIFEATTSDAFVLPKSGKPVFLELNYKCNHPFIVGIMANESQISTQVPVIFLNPSETWNKIYINLTQEVSSHTSAIDFSLFIGVSRDDT